MEEREKNVFAAMLYVVCCVLCFMCNSSLSHAKDNALIPKSAVEHEFFPPLDYFKGVDTVIYDFSSAAFPQDIVRPRFNLKDMTPAFDSVFLGYESLKVIPAYTNLQKISPDEKFKSNILNISITLTHVRKKSLYTNDFITLVSVSHRLRRGSEKTIIPDGNYAISFIYNGNKAQYLKDVHSSINTLIGYIPNYIVCANVAFLGKQCQGPAFKYHETENTE